MQTIDIHLADMAPWRALLNRAQFAARVELHSEIEEYLLGILYRATSAPANFVAELQAAHRSGSFRVERIDDLRTIGDHCLICTGLYPEQTIDSNLPLSYFAKLGSAAYLEFADLSGDPMFELLGEYFVDVLAVLNRLRDMEDDNIGMDPLNAYQLWQETGSVHAWRVMQRFTSALPGAAQPAAYH